MFGYNAFNKCLIMPRKRLWMLDSTDHFSTVEVTSIKIIFRSIQLLPSILSILLTLTTEVHYNNDMIDESLNL